MTTAWVMVGNADSTRMVCTPPPPMSNAMVAASELGLGSTMGWGNEAMPESLVFITVNVAGAVRSSSASSRSGGHVERSGAGRKLTAPALVRARRSILRTERERMGHLVVGTSL